MLDIEAASTAIDYIGKAIDQLDEIVCHGTSYESIGEMFYDDAYEIIDLLNAALKSLKNGCSE